MATTNTEEKEECGEVLDLAASLQLEPGEAYFVRYLQRYLPKSWQLYVQPPLNGKRPDVIVMNPRVGVMIYEVKNWNLDCYRRDGGVIRVHGTERPVAVPNPFGQLQVYREQILNVLVPELGLEVSRNRLAYGCVRIGLVFPHASASRARASEFVAPLLPENERAHVAIIGRDDLEKGAGSVAHVLPDATRDRSQFFKQSMAAELTRWISEPEAESEQREPLHLTVRQRELATTRTQTGYRRVKGGAGSGKSHALAARAGQLALEGKRVLACSFNITMHGYLSDLARRYSPERGAPMARAEVKRNVQFTWFHQFCKEQIIACEGKAAWNALFSCGREMSANDRAQLFSVVIPRMVGNLARRCAETLQRFDAILVDEGQDWNLTWWQVLRLFLAPGGEMLLVADRTQDLYRRAPAWTERAMTGAGFAGGTWYTLEASHRLHPAMVPMLTDFARRFEIPDADVPEADEAQGDLHAPRLLWMNVPEQHLQETAFGVISKLPDLMNGVVIPYPDMTVLLRGHTEGLCVVEHFKDRGVNVGHVFGETDEESRLRKIMFRKGMGKLKACTVHSFKGWEDRAIIVLVDRFDPLADGAQWLYTAMTRVRRSEQGACLVVLSSVPGLREFGRQWFAPITCALGS